MLNPSGMFLRLQNNKIKENSKQCSHTSVVEGLKVSVILFLSDIIHVIEKKMKPTKFETERIVMYCFFSPKRKTAFDINGLKCRNDMICTEVYI